MEKNRKKIFFRPRIEPSSSDSEAYALPTELHWGKENGQKLTGLWIEYDDCPSVTRYGVFVSNLEFSANIS